MCLLCIFCFIEETFISSAFDGAEKSIVKKTNVSADSNPKYDTNPVNATTDKVFLLSDNGVNKYFGSDEDRKCIPTEYAKANGAYISSSHTKNGVPTSRWWLRSFGPYQRTGVRVDIDGSVDFSGDDVILYYDCVRPAVWVNIK